MNKKKQKYLIVSAGILFLLAGAALFVFLRKPVSHYEYPVTPDSPQWRELTSHAQMVEACRIPSGTLDKMTDEALCKAVVEYPLIADIFANPVMDKEWSKQVLETRCDAFTELKARDSLNVLRDYLSGIQGDDTLEGMVREELKVILQEYV